MLEPLFEEISVSVKAAVVIDDDKRARDILRLLLELEGFVVDCCENGSSAHERLREMHFDLILIDYRLPETDGAEVTRSLRGLCPDAFIVGMSIESKQQEFMSAGADVFIHKARLMQDLLPVARRKLQQ
jgi:CheY-like chemotaxis protein